MKFTISAADHRGKIDNVSWSISKDMLLIQGNGLMRNFSDLNLPQWCEYRNDVKSVVVGKGVTSIGNFAFAGFEMMTTIYMPNTVKYIGDGAFFRVGLRNVEIPVTVLKIGKGAFFGVHLRSLEIPETVIKIGECAFWGSEQAVTEKVRYAETPMMVYSSGFREMEKMSVALGI